MHRVYTLQYNQLKLTQQLAQQLAQQVVSAYYGPRNAQGQWPPKNCKTSQSSEINIRVFRILLSRSVESDNKGTLQIKL